MDYLQQIALFSDTDAYDGTVERVSLMTLHAAKGLEFDHVFIIGLEDGLLPHERGTRDGDDLEEERRLFFVGVTRAKTNLTISYAQYRTIRGQTLRTTPSPFLFELGLALPRGVAADPYDRSDSVVSFEKPSSVVSVAKSEPRREPEFALGQLVRHKSFGLGRVKKYVDMGPSSIVTVQFNSGQTKSLLLQYAQLTKV